MAKWIPLKTAPSSWEGQHVWMWLPWNETVELRYLNPGYSREPHHCGGILAQEYKIPKPPRS